MSLTSRKKRNFKAMNKSREEEAEEIKSFKVKAKQKRVNDDDQNDNWNAYSSLNFFNQSSSNVDVNSKNEDEILINDDIIIKKVPLVSKEPNKDLIENNLINYKKFRKFKFKNSESHDSHPNNIIKLKIFKN